MWKACPVRRLSNVSILFGVPHTTVKRTVEIGVPHTTVKDSRSCPHKNQRKCGWLNWSINWLNIQWGQYIYRKGMGWLLSLISIVCFFLLFHARVITRLCGFLQVLKKKPEKLSAIAKPLSENVSFLAVELNVQPQNFKWPPQEVVTSVSFGSVCSVLKPVDQKQTFSESQHVDFFSHPLAGRMQIPS